MIPCDFEYYKPASAQKAVDLFQTLLSQGKNVLYYGGGTEIISFSRLYQLYPQAVIDIKGIPECNELRLQNDKLIIGSAVTLTQIQETNLFPLLNRCSGRIADHTIRNKITLGGNICARIPFREAILALLVSDCEIISLGKNGKKRTSIINIFHEVLQLEPGDLLLQVIVDQSSTQHPFFSTKQTVNGHVQYPQDKIGYPLLSTAFLNINGYIRAAFSGLCPFPFRNIDMEKALNKKSLSLEKRIDKALQLLPAPIVNDLDGSAEYREFIFRQTTHNAIEKLQGV